MSGRFVAAMAAGVVSLFGHSLASELPGTSAAIGAGSVQSYIALDAAGAPAEIGVIFSAGAFEGLPDEPNNVSRCFDRDGNGRINESGECEGDYEIDLPFSTGLAGRTDIPFVFAMVNFHAHGHPPQAWAVPHFDVHFYQIAPEAVHAIAVGSCDFFIDCAVRDRAQAPVPAKYVHADFADVGAVVGLMGNHLIDTKTPELADDGPPFTHTWIYGAFGGEVIFQEIMATTAFLTATPDACVDIKQPAAWQRAGYYPTRYCFRRDPADGAMRVYLTDFVMREAG